MKLLIVFVLLPCMAFAQAKPGFNKLVEETNKCLRHYSQLSPFEDYHSVSSLGLSEKEIADIRGGLYDYAISPEDKDLILSQDLIGYFQKKFVALINQVIKHPDFRKVSIVDLIQSDDLFIAVSEDHKLYNFSLDEKTGGSYRSRISVMHYTDFSPRDSTELAAFHSFFAPDGYDAIYALATEEGTKYVLTGHVRGCSYCFMSFVDLVCFQDNEFRSDFSYSVDNRDGNDGVAYNPDDKTITVDYHLDDLSQTCDCAAVAGGDGFSHDDAEAGNYTLSCLCKFLFDGLTFELVEAGWKKTYNKE